ncbi:DUF3040 domain-containing protein [Actinokineospora sp. 24-640]
MDFRGLSRDEQRRLDEIEQHLGHEAPEVVSAFRSAAVAPGDSSGRAGLVTTAALLTLFGLLADVPLAVICGMAGAVAALLLPYPDWLRAQRGTPG